MLSLIPKFALWPFVRQVASKGITAVAVGASGLIARSIDGTSWAEMATGLTTANLHQAAYGNGQWMACGTNCTILRSIDDGVTWEKLTIPAAIVSGTPLDQGSIVFDSGRFLVLGSNSSYFFTTDNGATWTRGTYTAPTQTGFRGGKAKRLSTGAIYQPGVGDALRGFHVFTWNGNGYTVTTDNVTSGSQYIVIGSITESKEYLVAVRQGAGAYRRKPSDTSWTATRASAASNALYSGGSATQVSTDTVFQIGNADSATGQSLMYKGVAGTAWEQIPAATMNTMFGANQALRDIYAAGSNSLIIGDEKIWYSADWANWNLTYTARSVVSSITVRQLTLSDFNRWRHFSFATNEHIDDVTEKFGILAGSGISIADNKVTTTTAASSMRIKDTLLFKDNEDFTIGLTITPLNTLSAAAITTDLLIAGSCDVPGDTAGTFYILYGKNFNKFLFYVKVAGAFIALVPGQDVVVAAGADLHIEFSRKGGQFYVFMNGVKQTLSTVNNGGIGPQPASARGIGFGTNSNSYAFRGTRRGLYIDKGICRHTESFTPDTSVQTYVRPLYSVDDAKAIRAQVGFRRDAVIDEANDRVVVNTGGANQVVQQGRMKFTGTQASTNGFMLLADPFGAGDFTIECSFNMSVAGATAGFLLLSEWWLGSATNDLNRWALLIAADRKAYFQMNRSTVGTDAVSLYSTVALALNIDYRVIVERVAGVLTLYILDAHTGVQVDKLSAPCTFPIRGEAPRFVRNYSPGTGNYSGTGWIWDIRIADKAMYNGVVDVAATFPGFPDNKYTTAEEANVVTQATVSRSPRDDKLGTLITVPAANGSVLSSRISTNGGFAWAGLTPAFSAGDFTIEARLVVSSISGNPVSLIGQFLNSASNNSWQFRLMDGKIGLVLSSTGAALTGLVVITNPEALVLNQEYYVVAERVGTTITLYFDGVAKASGTFSGALPATTLPIQRGDIGSGGLSVRDVRISKTSQYKGTVPKFPQYKRLNTIKPSLTMGFFSGDVGTIYGYMENSSYSVSSGGGAYISLGSCTHKLFRYTSGSTTIVRRLKGLFMDRGSFLILGWEDTTLTPTSDMPAWTNTLIINGVTFVYNQQPTSGFVSPLGAQSGYWSGVTAMNPLAEGREIAFEFV